MQLNIGSQVPANPVFLAPMTGVSDLPFRRLAHEQGAGLVVSEMVASAELVQKRADVVRRAEGTGLRPFVIQLVGCEARWMAEGARIDHSEHLWTAHDAHRLYRSAGFVRGGRGIGRRTTGIKTSRDLGPSATREQCMTTGQGSLTAEGVLDGSSSSQLVRAIDWRGAFWVASGVPALVLFSIGGIAGVAGKVAFLVWTVSMIDPPAVRPGRRGILASERDISVGMVGVLAACTLKARRRSIPSARVSSGPLFQESRDDGAETGSDGLVGRRGASADDAVGASVTQDVTRGCPSVAGSGPVAGG